MPSVISILFQIHSDMQTPAKHILFAFPCLPTHVHMPLSLSQLVRGADCLLYQVHVRGKYNIWCCLAVFKFFYPKSPAFSLNHKQHH